MKWNFSENSPIYLQIMEHIKEFIVSGELKPGERLASVRELAAEARVNPNTMQKALSELEYTGLIYSQRTSGRFITAEKKLIQNVKNEIAAEKVNTFLAGMRQLGYTDDEVMEIIKENKEEIINE